MDITAIWERYGFWGFITYVALVQVWPYMRDKFFPEQLKERRAAADWQRKMDERMVTSMEEMQRAMVAQNEKLNNLIAQNIEHDRTMRDAILKMVEARPKRRGES